MLKNSVVNDINLMFNLNQMAAILKNGDFWVMLQIIETHLIDARGGVHQN